METINEYRTRKILSNDQIETRGNKFNVFSEIISIYEKKECILLYICRLRPINGKSMIKFID